MRYCLDEFLKYEKEKFEGKFMRFSGDAVFLTNLLKNDKNYFYCFENIDVKEDKAGKDSEKITNAIVNQSCLKDIKRGRELGIIRHYGYYINFFDLYSGNHSTREKIVKALCTGDYHEVTKYEKIIIENMINHVCENISVQKILYEINFVTYSTYGIKKNEMLNIFVDYINQLVESKDISSCEKELFTSIKNNFLEKNSLRIQKGVASFLIMLLIAGKENYVKEFNCKINENREISVIKYNENRSRLTNGTIIDKKLSYSAQNCLLNNEAAIMSYFESEQKIKKELYDFAVNDKNSVVAVLTPREKQMADLGFFVGNFNLLGYCSVRQEKPEYTLLDYIKVLGVHLIAHLNEILDETDYIDIEKEISAFNVRDSVTFFKALMFNRVLSEYLKCIDTDRIFVLQGIENLSLADKKELVEILDFCWSSSIKCRMIVLTADESFVDKLKLEENQILRDDSVNNSKVLFSNEKKNIDIIEKIQRNSKWDNYLNLCLYGESVITIENIREIFEEEQRDIDSFVAYTQKNEIFEKLNPVTFKDLGFKNYLFDGCFLDRNTYENIIINYVYELYSNNSMVYATISPFLFEKIIRDKMKSPKCKEMRENISFHMGLVRLYRKFQDAFKLKQEIEYINNYFNGFETNIRLKNLLWYDFQVQLWDLGTDGFIEFGTDKVHEITELFNINEPQMDIDRKIHYYENLSWYYTFDDANFDLANNYIDKALDLYESNDAMWLHQKDFRKAHTYYLKSHVLYQMKCYNETIECIDNAIDCINNVLDQDSFETHLQKALCYRKEGDSYRSLENYNKALDSYCYALKIYDFEEEKGNSVFIYKSRLLYYIAITYKIIGINNKSIKDLEEANKTLLLSKQIFNEHSLSLMINKESEEKYSSLNKQIEDGINEIKPQRKLR